MMNLNPIDPVRGTSAAKDVGKAKLDAAAKPGQPSFKDTLSNFLNEVNSMQLKADESIEKMAAGEITDVHQVMNSVQEANVAFNLMMEIRNKVMDAYKEIERMRI
jgi:flagellar hook-basal body complex protein FliE